MPAELSDDGVRSRSPLIWRLRYLLIAIGSAPFFATAYEAHAGDWLWFEFAGRVAAHFPGYYRIPGGPLHLWVWEPKLQFGPPTAVAAVPFQLLDPAVGRLLAALAMAAAGLLALVLGERMTVVGEPTARRAAASIAGGVVAMAAWMQVAAAFLHLDDVIAVVLLMLSTAAARRSRWTLAAALIGTAAAAKPWAVIFLALLVMAPRADRARAVLVAIVAGAAWWVPVIAAAPGTVAALGSVHLPVSSTAPLVSLPFIEPGRILEWIRPLQLAAGFVAVALVAHRRGVVPALAVGFAVRVLLDPQSWSYYYSPLVLACLLVDWQRGHRVPSLTLVATTTQLVVPALSMPVAAESRLLGVLLILVGVVLAPRAATRNSPNGLFKTTASRVDRQGVIEPIGL